MSRSFWRISRPCRIFVAHFYSDGEMMAGSSDLTRHVCLTHWLSIMLRLREVARVSRTYLLYICCGACCKTWKGLTILSRCASYAWIPPHRQKFNPQSWQNMDMLHARSSDPYVCMLALFCMCYEHLLIVVDDEEVKVHLCNNIGHSYLFLLRGSVPVLDASSLIVLRLLRSIDVRARVSTSPVPD